VRAELDANELARTGRAMLELAFTPREKIPGRWLVRLRLRADDSVLWRQEHGPDLPTDRWEKDRVVRYEVPLALPLGFELPEEPLPVSLWLSFYDPREDRELPPRGTSELRGALRKVAGYSLRRPGSALDAAGVQAVINEADSWAKEGRKRAAWGLLTRTHRKLEDYDLKAQIRNALLRVGRFEPRPIDSYERGIVQQRIADERRRYVRRVAGRMLDRKDFEGALYLLRKIGGSLEEGVDQAHIGDIGRVRRQRNQIEDVERKLLRRVRPEEQKQIEAAFEKHGLSKKLLAFAKQCMERHEYGIARSLFQMLTRGEDSALRQESLALFPEVEKRILEYLPTDQKATADAAWDHPAWARTQAIPSKEFIFIGPEQLLGGIPDDSKLRFDLAYLYLTDLFGRVPNPDGDRVTVYYKELWNFSGGVGGGKTIDIGNADPNARRTRVDNGLLYHELVHCVDDTNPVLGGFREGLADFGAAFVFEALGQKTPTRWTYVHNLRAFEQDYLERDLEFWRIPNYGPSAGFFLWFVERYGKKGQKRQWQLYRRFFRAYRYDKVRDGRTPSVIRALAYRLIEQFGPQVFDDLQRFRFPLQPSDRKAIEAEQANVKTPYQPEKDEFKDFPNSPVRRDVEAMALADERAPLGEWAARLGVIRDWKAIGPFKQPGYDPGARVWPPEYEVDFSKTYDVPRNTALWRGPSERPPIKLSSTGWLSFHWEYMDNSAIYALTHLRPAQPCDARIWLRADDEVTLFVNDQLVGQYRGQQDHRLGPWRPGRGVLIADAIVFDVHLRGGRNKVLLKIRNYGGGAGVVMAVSDRAGQPLPGLESDVEPPMQITHHLPDSRSGRWKNRLKAAFVKRGGERCFDMQAGRFRVQRRSMAGTESGGGVPWRKYTVRPSYNRDAPSNFGWLRSRYTKKLGDFRLELGISPEQNPPKFALCFQGQGNDDPLSGHTLIVVPRGGKAVRLRLERYGRLLYQSEEMAWPAGSEDPVVLQLHLDQERVSAWLAEKQLLDQVPIRGIADRDDLGLATWNDRTRFVYLKLESR
jgi:hypothetical protein